MVLEANSWQAHAAIKNFSSQLPKHKLHAAELSLSFEAAFGRSLGGCFNSRNLPAFRLRLSQSIEVALLVGYEQLHNNSNMKTPSVA